MTGPGKNETAAAVSGFRVSHADRERVVGTLKTAFVQGRLTGDELGARAGQVYASRTYAELAGVTADLPDELTRAPSVPRNAWRGTKIAWRAEYALVLPGLVALLIGPNGPDTTPAEIAAMIAVVYLVFWALGAALVIASRSSRRAGTGRECLHASHAVARDQVIRILSAALAQGRLTEDEHDVRSARVPASRRVADLDRLIADLPAGLAAKPPTARDVRVGAGVSVAAGGTLAAVFLAHPGNYLGFALAFLAVVILLFVPAITVGLMADVRHQTRANRRG